MSGHTRWEGLKPLEDQESRRTQLAYVDGYLLALEDLLKDIKHMIQTDDLPHHAGFAAMAMIREVRGIVAETQKQARRTRDLLLNVKTPAGSMTPGR